MIQPPRGCIGDMRAQREGWFECMRLLLAHGVAADVTSRLSQTTLHFVAAYTPRGGESLDAEQERVRFAAMLLDAGARLDAVYFCPHHPSEGEPPYRRECACRKPGSALVRAAQRDLELDLARSWMIGDARRDLAAGAALGVRGILVATGKGAREAEKLSALERSRTLFAADLAQAVELALGA